MGKLNNRRLYAAGLGIAAVGLVLDRTVFREEGLGPQAASAQTGPAEPAAVRAPAATPEPDRAAVASLVQKLKQLEESRSLDVSRVRDVFTLGPDGPIVGAVADAGSSDQALAEEFKKNHRLRTVLIPRTSDNQVVPKQCMAILESPEGDPRPIRIGESVDGFRLELVDWKNDLGTATFVSGKSRVELIVPTKLKMPEIGPKEPPRPPSGS